jgi:DNA-binding beta-propeller fold protein YncE
MGARLTLGRPGSRLRANQLHRFRKRHVRPIAMSLDGSRLFAVNTPDNTLEIFDIDASGLTFAASVAVGMEPVAVAARTQDEIWVVNHLSDSVSIVDFSGASPIVERTLLVGDEPRDIVFAGTGGNRAFISTAHRGQHRAHSSISSVFSGSNPADPRLTTSGVDRADLWVFDALSLGNTIGGTDDPEFVSLGRRVREIRLGSGRRRRAKVPSNFSGEGDYGEVLCLRER